MNTEKKIEELEKRILTIEKRNNRVEADKAWETSLGRIFSITILTYLVVVIVMVIIDITSPMKNAIIPTIGFVLSTQSLPIIKRLWVQKRLNNKS